jgi:secreted trypsin-like serine protease
MKNTPVLLLLLLSCLPFSACTNGNEGQPKTSACSVLGLSDRSASFDTKIVQGTQCNRSGSPVVSITLLAQDGGVGLCSGTAISARHVLTAAHCFIDGINAASVQAAGVDIPVEKVFIHPDFQDKSIPLQNDAAIVRTSKDLNVPAQSLLLSRAIEPDDIIAIFGFGNDQDQTSGVLRSGEMKIAGINGQFFIAEFEEKGSNICQGDSGGPAIQSYRDSEGNRRQGIVGITSFGEIPCDESGSSGFQNIQSTSIINFVTSIVPAVGVQ